MHCIRCGQATTNAKFCGRSCSVSHNNSIAPKRKQVAHDTRCAECDAVIKTKGANFCSQSCAWASKRKIKLQRWLDGAESGLNSKGLVLRYIKQWLRYTRGNYCSLCGWAEIHPTTGLVPLVADHIDGDWRNNRPENLRLLCGCCDSLQPTFQALNKGNGRTMRKG